MRRRHADDLGDRAVHRDGPVKNSAQSPPRLRMGLSIDPCFGMSPPYNAARTTSHVCGCKTGRLTFTSARSFFRMATKKAAVSGLFNSRLRVSAGQFVRNFRAVSRSHFSLECGMLGLYSHFPDHWTGAARYTGSSTVPE